MAALRSKVIQVLLHLVSADGAGRLADEGVQAGINGVYIRILGDCVLGGHDEANFFSSARSLARASLRTTIGFGPGLGQESQQVGEAHFSSKAMLWMARSMSPPKTSTP